MSGTQEKKTWTVREVLEWAMGDFRSRSLSKPRLEAEVLLASALARNRLWLYTNFDAPLSDEERTRIREFVQRRRNGEPSAYITGEKEFWSRSFEVNPKVLVPRPETETLIDLVLREMKRYEAPRILDLGTGCGVIGITLACEIPGAEILATDISAEALETAGRNAERHSLSDRISFAAGDGFSPLEGRSDGFDAIVSNPPYIRSADIERLESEVRDFEPRLALDGGPDGLGFISRLVSEAPRHLKRGGLLAFEIGFDQAPLVIDLLQRTGAYATVRIARDLAGVERVAAAWYINGK